MSTYLKATLKKNQLINASEARRPTAKVNLSRVLPYGEGSLFMFKEKSLLQAVFRIRIQGFTFLHRFTYFLRVFSKTACILPLYYKKIKKNFNIIILNITKSLFIEMSGPRIRIRSAPRIRIHMDIMGGSGSESA